MQFYPTTGFEAGSSHGTKPNSFKLALCNLVQEFCRADGFSGCSIYTAGVLEFQHIVSTFKASSA